MQTQLEFKTQDCKQLQERCKILEDKLHQLQTSETLLTSSSKKSPGKSPSKSPKLKLVSSGKICVEERGDFPSPSSFMSTSSTSKRTDICMKNAGKKLSFLFWFLLFSQWRATLILILKTNAYLEYLNAWVMLKWW